MLSGAYIREVERQEDNILLIAGAAWHFMLVSLAVASVVAAWLWPSGSQPGTAA